MILKYLRKKEWGLILFCTLLIIVQVWLDLRIPDFMYEITTLIQEGGTVKEILDPGIGMLACAFGSLVMALIVGYISAYIAASLSRRLRTMEFDKVQSFSATEINRFSTASLITRSTNDITQVQMVFAMGMQVIIKAPILAVWAIFKISGKSWQWTAATAVAIIVMICVLAILMKFVIPRFKKIQWMTDDVNRNMRENLKGIRVVRAYNAENYQENRFEKANDNLTENNLFTGRSMAVMMPMMTTIMSVLSLSIYWIGAILISSAGLETQVGLFSDMVVFLSYAMQIVMAFVMLVMVFMILPRATVAAKRIEEIINTEPTITDGAVTESPENRKGEIVFDNVGFKYPGAADYVLENISFSVNKGETVAFIGSTGSGKSTIVNLLLRSYDVTDGKVLVDGVDVRDYTLDSLHRKIGYVPQKANLFSGTVSFNVKYGDTAPERSEDDVKKAVEIAQGTEFVEKMEGGYEAMIAQGGTNVSGGQKQRLSIARAICRKPEIYIFDDSFSALDYKTDRKLRSALKRETANITNIIVAQRVGTIMDADKIVVIDDGKIVGIGKHHDLLESCPVYTEIVKSQLTQEDLSR